MTEFTINPKDPEALLYVLAEASIEFNNEGHFISQSVIDELRDQLRGQVKPAIEEPLAFGSVVKANSGTLYVRLGAAQALPWGSGEQMRSWDQLAVVEVLRVGIGTVEPVDGFCSCPPDGKARDCGIRRHRVEAPT